MVAGLSVVTNPIGIERVREIQNSGDATLLYYLGPEIRLTFDALPETEFVYRVHHRSGAGEVSFLPTLGDMVEGANANVFGIRLPF